ncbi:cob(I)yrinic acid a,c-diamide adenosyltransferase [Candidatus Gottesmanbacteria bacterium]|nr:cob(I)yrinic acid a,c-diamide adenosyltransferase [Candidatus Gottesmanbacteria bacterium]MBM3713122.1 cob(I)yrinic acid a,c-diamide adenosyltransferase [Actinomycetota bacterium]
MKIYTRAGDRGETSLFTGERVLKNDIRIHTYGLIDELNSLLGVVLSKLKDKRVERFINQIQKDLFLIGSYLAGSNFRLDVLTQRVKEMEEIIDTLSSRLPKLSHFILPEGTESATLLYFTRAVARRVERELVALSTKESINKNLLIYTNRLSDLFFVLARYLNFKAGVSETIWKKGSLSKPPAKKY